MMATFAQQLLDGAIWVVLGGVALLAVWLSVLLFAAVASSFVEVRAEREAARAATRPGAGAGKSATR